MTEKRNLSVLVVDDEAHIRAFIGQVLKTMNCEVVAEAANGLSAVELFTQHKPHMTFLDVNMPGMDGRETLRSILNIDPQAIVIMLTSQTAIGIVEELLSLGASNYIRKDTPLAEMKRIIKETWDESRSLD